MGRLDRRHGCRLDVGLAVRRRLSRRGLLAVLRPQLLREARSEGGAGGQGKGPVAPVPRPRGAPRGPGPSGRLIRSMSIPSLRLSGRASVTISTMGIEDLLATQGLQL